jgi:hypothetical protein
MGTVGIIQEEDGTSLAKWFVSQHQEKLSLKLGSERSWEAGVKSHEWIGI